MKKDNTIESDEYQEHNLAEQTERVFRFEKCKKIAEKITE